MHCLYPFYERRPLRRIFLFIVSHLYFIGTIESTNMQVFPQFPEIHFIKNSLFFSLRILNDCANIMFNLMIFEV